MSVDTSLSQIYLARLKWISSLTFDPEEGAKFLGFLEADRKFRAGCLHRAGALMRGDEKAFWRTHRDLVERGVIHTARFERYLSRYQWIALHLVGRAKLLKLMELDSVEEQGTYFDDHFNVAMLRKLFDVLFSPRRYRNRAVAEQGFRNAGTDNRAAFFFSRFRAFCASTPARRNYYLQFYLFNRLLFREALPDYLTESGEERIRRNRDGIAFASVSYRDALEQDPPGRYNKFHLSNIVDWMTIACSRRLTRVPGALIVFCRGFSTSVIPSPVLSIRKWP
jgi:S-adenosylmethionine:diacylglycerol 3-amino-3-carboxypropyl transferase